MESLERAVEYHKKQATQVAQREGVTYVYDGNHADPVGYLPKNYWVRFWVDGEPIDVGLDTGALMVRGAWGIAVMPIASNVVQVRGEKR